MTDPNYSTGRQSAHEVGMTNRRAVLGDAHVDAALAKQSPVTEKFQDFITRTAWGDIWNRDGLDHTQRRLLTTAILTAVYAGVPNSNHAFKLLAAAVAEQEAPKEK